MVKNRTKKKLELIGRNKLDYLPPIFSLDSLGRGTVTNDSDKKNSLVVHGDYLREDPRAISRETVVAYKWGVKNGSPELKERLNRCDHNNLAIAHDHIKTGNLRVYGWDAKKHDEFLLRSLEDLGFALHRLECLDVRQYSELEMGKDHFLRRSEVVDFGGLIDSIFKREKEMQEKSGVNMGNKYNLMYLDMGVRFVKDPSNGLVYI